MYAVVNPGFNDRFLPRENVLEQGSLEEGTPPRPRGP